MHDFDSDWPSHDDDPPKRPSLEVPSMEVEADFNSLQLRFEQRPFRGWGFAGIAVGLLLSSLSANFGGEVAQGVANVTLFAMLAFTVWTLQGDRPARLRLGPTTLRVMASTGRLAWKRHLDLPLAGLELEVLVGKTMDQRETYDLRLLPRDAPPIRLYGLARTRSELQRLQDEVAAAQADARARIGDGEDEVPEALRAARGKAQPDRA